LFLSDLVRKPVVTAFVAPTDHYFYVTSELLELQDESDKTDPLFIIAGASVTQSSFGGTKKVGKALEAAFDDQFDVKLMTTGRQNLIEHFMIFDSLPKQRPVLAVRGVGPSRFTWDDEQYLDTYASDRFGINSPAYIEQLSRLDPAFQAPAGHPLLDHFGFYASRLDNLVTKVARAVRGRKTQRNENQFLGRLLPEEEYLKHSARVLERFNVERDTITQNHDLLRDLLAFVQSRENIELVVFEHPINPYFLRDFLDEEIYAQHLADMRRITEAAGVPYITPGLDSGLNAEDFFDWAHISTETAQDSLRNAVVHHLRNSAG
jgi:hypothetical protein